MSKRSEWSTNHCAGSLQARRSLDLTYLANNKILEVAGMKLCAQ